MNLVDFLYYGAIVLPFAWLLWLSSRPFLVNLNRLLLAISGVLAYGFVGNTLIFPLFDTEKAHVAATLNFGMPIGLSEATGHVFYFLCCVGIPLFGVSLLLLWLQRVLARSPRQDPAGSR